MMSFKRVMSFRSVFSAAVLSWGVLGMAVAQEIASDVTGTTGPASQQNAAPQQNAGEADTGDAQTGVGNASPPADVSADAALDADRAQGAISGQTEAGDPNSAATRSQESVDDLTVPKRETDAAADTTTGDDRGPANMESNTGTFNDDARFDTQTGAQMQGDTAGMLFRSNTEGIVVDSVAENSAAARLGLQQGDEIVRFNGQWVNDPEQLQRMMRTIEGSRPVDISFRRDGRQMGRQITLNRSGQSQSAMRPSYDEDANGDMGSAEAYSDPNPAGTYQDQPMQQPGFRQPYSQSGGYQYGPAAAGFQPYGGDGHSDIGACCCPTVNHSRRAQRRARRAARRCCR